MKSSVSRLVGTWDGRNSGLGSFVIFISELLQLKSKLSATSLTVQIKTGYPDFAKLSKEILQIDSIKYPYDEIEVGEEYDYFWPPKKDLTYSHDTTKFLQKCFYESGRLVPLSFKKGLQEKVLRILKSEGPDRFSCILHLKQHPLNTDSNAILSEWFQFVSHMQSSDVTFFPIGNESLPEEFLALKNVDYSFMREGNLIEQLAAIEVADAFMGMSTGPSNIAIVGTKPYVIFKHPEHHKLEMQNEIGDAKIFPFARANQYILRQNENAEVLREYIERILAIGG